MLEKTRTGARPGRVGGAARLALATAVALTMLVAVAPSASADTLYVAKNGAGATCTQAAPCSTITTAVDASRITEGPDRIVVGPGVFVESVELNSLDNSLEIVGAGNSDDPAQATIVRPPALNKAPLIVGPPILAPEDVSVRNLRLHVPDQAPAPLDALVSWGARLTVTDVAIDFDRPVAVDRVVGVYGPDSTFERVTVDSAGTGRAVGVFTGENFTLRDSSVRSPAAAVQAEYSPGLRIVRSRLTTTGDGRVLGALASGGTVDSTLVRGGNRSIAVWAPTGSEHELVLRNVTVDAGGAGADPTKYALETYADGNGKARIIVRNSILLERSEADDERPTAIVCAHTAAPSQVAPGPNGQIDCGAGKNGNIDTTPAALFGGALQTLVPPFGSPAIDSGDPAPLPAGASTTDLAGRPRVADGNGDGVAIVDRGAYELPPPVEPEDTTAPTIVGLKVAPKRFRAAPAATPRVAAKRKRRAVKRGATISYRIDEAARVVFTVQRRAVGRRAKGGRCVAPKRSNRRAKRCARWVTDRRTLTRDVTAGAQRLRFSGRIGRKALRPGAYRVSAVATDAAGNRSRPTRPAQFTIVR